MKISTPEIKVIRFSSEDVIAASGSLTGSNGLFYIPSSQYSGYSGSADYVEFSGTIGSKSGVGYLIENIHGAKGDVSDDRAGLMAGSSYYFPDMGITVDNSHMAPIAQQSYDAFRYDDGQYYTNGISYYTAYWQ